MPEQDFLDQINSLLSAQSNQTFAQFLDEKCRARGVSGNELAHILGNGRRSIQRILNGEAKTIDAETVLKISEFLGIDVKVLLNAYIATASPEEVKALERARKAGFLTENFDLKKLKEIGFLNNARDYDEIEKRILDFFDLSTLSEFTAFNAIPLFSRTRNKSSDKMLVFWLAIVRARMQSVKNPNVYDSDRLEKIIPLFRSATLDVANGFNSAVRTIWECGVTVIVESYLTKTQIRSGTFISNGKPYIFLTKYPAYYDTLWFALLHELAHVLFDQDILQKGSGSHLSGGEGLFEDPLLEAEADNFATAILLPKDRLQYAKSIIHIPGFVEQAAKEWGVHPSIVYGMHCYANPEDFPKFSHHRLKADEAVKFDYTTWQKNTLEETVPLLKKQLTLVS